MESVACIVYVYLYTYSLYCACIFYDVVYDSDALKTNLQTNIYLNFNTKPHNYV